jgi:phospholipid/cholesterol/gamma-HCH transport system substrate-binding protein
MGREKHILSRQVGYRAVFKDIKGLSKGAPVRLGGISVGRVGDISFSKNPQDPSIKVDILLAEEFSDRLRTDAQVTIDTQGLLGDRYLSIVGGNAPEVLAPGSEVHSQDSTELSSVIGKVHTIVEDTSAVARDLTSITGKVKEEGVKRFVDAVDSLARILEEIEHGHGLAHEIVYGASGKETIDKLKSSATNLEEATGVVRDYAHSIRDSDGILQQLLAPTEGDRSIKEIAKNLATASQQLSVVIDSVARGNGTLGALLMDSSLYDNVVEVTDGAKRSFLLRQAIRATLGGAPVKAQPGGG